MKKAILFMLLVACFASQAQTIQVNGIQTGVWDADTVLVTGDVMVKDSVLVLPGTVVLFDGFYRISVRMGSSFEALGTEKDSIVFTVADTTGFHYYDNGKGGWNGFRLINADHFLLDYCVLQYGKAADTADRFGGAIYMNRCKDVEIRNSTLRCNFSREQGGAIYGINSAVTMSDCQINENLVFTKDDTYALYGGGAQFLKCDVVMTGMEFRANYGPSCIGGALSLDSCSVTLDRSVFVDNVGINGGGLYLMRSNHKECKFSNLVFDDNFSYHFGGGFALLDVSPEVSNVLVVNNSSYGVSCDGIFFYGYSSPKMFNCIIYGNYAPDTTMVLDTAQMWAWTYEETGPEFYNCLVEGGMKYIHSPENIRVFENIIDADPMFVDAANHDFRLSPNSPCVDAGSDLTPQYVLDGFDLAWIRRVSNGRIDIGPYEYSGASVPKYVYTSFAKLIGNPLCTQSRIELDCDMEGDVLVTVCSMRGHCVASKLINISGLRYIEIGGLVDGLAPGVYLIALKHKNRICTLKAVR